MEGTPTDKKIVIFTQFSEISEAYSLNRVVQDQIKMLVRNGYKPTVIVQEGFVPAQMYAHPDVTIETIPLCPCHNEVQKDPTFDEDVAGIERRLREILTPDSVVLTHDVVYQPAALKHNFAARKVAKDIPCRWLHWIHSATSPVTLGALRPYFTDEYLNLVQQPFPNSYYIFFNNYSIPRVAQNFEVPEEVVKVVHHPTDVCGFLGISPEVQEVVDRKKILSVDAICTYPIRLDRGKQVEYVIKTMSELRRFDLSIRVIIIDFHSTGGDKITYRDELKNIAIDCGLNSDEITFTSEEKEEWKVEVPQSVVRDFQLLSNVFIMPSVSESYSLVTQEAALTKQVVVANFDFPPFRDIFGSDPIFRKFSSNIDIMSGLDGNTTTEYGPNNISKDERKKWEKDYHYGTAGLIASRLKHPEMALSIKLRKERNLDSVFKKELEPLLYE
jgi:glycosyltransferase involved in cell wall biosynthesis